MKYFILGLLSLPLITSCTVVQEEYYGPPPAHVEVYRNDNPGYYHRPHAHPYQRGQVYSRSPRYVERPANTHGHGQRGVVVPQNAHGHGQAAQAPQNTHGHGQAAQAPQNAHGHGQAAVQAPKKAQSTSTPGASTGVNQPGVNNGQAQSTVHGHN